MSASYKLSTTLNGHSQDVRCVASTSSSAAAGGSAASPHVLSSSRDSTAISWKKLDTSGASWTQDCVFSGHENFVGAVTSTVLADGSQVVVTGSNDSTICVWSLLAVEGSRPEPLRVLIGHAANVCTLDAQAGLLVSGSWDQTAKIWDLNDDSGEAKLTLAGSELSIWAVKFLPNASRGNVQTLTASADKLIRLYNNASLVRTFKGHSEPVRALALLPSSTGENLFASAGNDGSIRIWNWQEGSQLKQLDGHDSFVYSLACTGDGTLVSSGEDRSVRTWNRAGGQLDQIITLPAISVWSVAVLSGSSDIIVGSSDSKVRIFTTATERQASSEELSAYEESIAASAINTNQVGDVKKSDLKSEDTLLSRRGKKEGEIAMVKNSMTGDVEAHQWSQSEGKWVKIGSVVDAVGSGRKQLYQGREYDYVFDVDVEEGKPPLKLPYNVTQNPYEAAQKFLTANELPPSYVDQVVQFIEKNTGGTTLGGQGGMDPYTGASSYQSGGNARNASGSASAATGSFSGDPWGSLSSSTQHAQSSSLFPLTSILSFSQANTAAISKKLFDLNQALAEQPSTATEFPLDNAETTTLQSLVSSLNTAPSSFSIDNASKTLLEKLLDWPSSSRFPVLDLIRVIAIHENVSFLLFQLLNNVSPDPSASLKENQTNAMLALRGAANMFLKGKNGLAENASEALETLSVVGTQDVNKNARIALATVALNYSVLAVEGRLKTSAMPHLLDLVEILLRDDEPETVYRSLVALGNIVYAPDSVKGGLQVGKLHTLKARAQTLAAAGEQRTKEVTREIAKKM